MQRFTSVDFVSRTVMICASIIALSAAGIALSSCGTDKPIAPDPASEWCQADASVIVGEWQAERRQLGHDHLELLTLDQGPGGPCHLTYSYQARQLASEEHPKALTVYRSQGDMLITVSRQRGPVSYLAIESRRWLMETFDEQGAIASRDTSWYVMAPAQAVVWNDLMKLWGTQYRRTQ